MSAQARCLGTSRQRSDLPGTSYEAKELITVRMEYAMEELTSYERQLCTQMLEHEDPERRLGAQMTLAEDAVLRSDLISALDMADRGMEIARSLDDEYATPQVLMTRAAILWDLQRHEAASIDYVDAAALYRRLDDRDSEGLAYLRLAWVAFESEEFDAVFGHLRRAVDVYRNPADERVLGNLLRIAEECLAIDRMELSLQCSELAGDIASGFQDEPLHWNARGLQMLALHGLGRSSEATALGETLLSEGLAADSRDRTFGIAIMLMQIHQDLGHWAAMIKVNRRLTRQFNARLTQDQRQILLELRDVAQGFAA